MARVLVVDDEREGRDLLAKRLRAEGHDVVERGDGGGAIEEVRQGGVDLVLLDAMMPVMDGIEACRQLKEIQGGDFLPIIMITALGEEESPRARDAGADDYITKPWRPRDLLARVNVQLRTLDVHRKLQTAKQEVDEKNVELNAMNERLAALATTDGLTGLLNHRRLQERLVEEGRRAKRQQQTIGALMVDIDCFKALNDAQGHLFGDRVLQHVAAKIRQSLRGVDIIGRYGGEEFAAILIETTKEEAIEAAGRVRAAVGEAPYRSEGHEPVRVTVSVGASAFPDDTGDFHRVLAAADMALYAAKRNGRDRVEHLSRHTFRYEASEGAALSSVHLSGDFNGWNRTSHPLEKKGEGPWEIETVVPTGRQRYKFYLNAEHWVPDPKAEATEYDAYKEPISIVTIR